MTPTKIPVNDFIVATEKATWFLSPEKADQLRAEVTGILTNDKFPKSSLSKEEHKAMLDLQKDKSILIMPADKGRSTVVMDKDKYEQKVKDILNDEKTYMKLDKDPTPKYKHNLVDILKKLKTDNKITPAQYDYLYLTAENVPRMYCTPKIHKPNTPLRLIVDYTGSIGYDTSRALADILGPLVGTTQYHVKNSKDFSKCMATVMINENEMFNSHDVVSLFTNTPIEKVLRVNEDRLKADQQLKKSTNLSVQDIMTLLKFILTTTYFTFRDQIYQKKFGTAMGSPVSPIVANLLMEFLEQQAIATAPLACRPKLWKRYVDDVHEIIRKGQVQHITDHLN
ncbi:uncharacterized protein LOC128554747 [Mercenaria mercenaria]|uniref:uncharacterized protein LOC128554747 n=1 Tax=Mercenaria mercenaria TaxID=6596 RepID=UPI00234EEEB8|nr:uncharacterized protein LOC128554747 [Mercenaria mercenaria]